MYIRTRATFPGCSPMGVSRWIRACNAIHVCNVRFSTCSNRTRMKFIASLALLGWQTFEIPDREKISFESEMKERYDYDEFKHSFAS